MEAFRRLQPGACNLPVAGLYFCQVGLGQEGSAVQKVAHHLQVKAVALEDPVERDLFGRSSYNRYYYATFLSVRAVLAEMRSEWGEMAHASLPEVLTAKVCNTLGKGRKKADKMGDMELVRQCNRAIKAAKELALLMRTSSATRVVADYHPEILISFVHGERFTLNEVGITEAHQWPEKAKAWLVDIQGAWNQLDD